MTVFPTVPRDVGGANGHLCPPPDSGRSRGQPSGQPECGEPAVWRGGRAGQWVLREGVQGEPLLTWGWGWVQGYTWVSDLVRVKGWQLMVGILLGTGLHLGVRSCQTEGVTAHGGYIAGYRATSGCQTMSDWRGDSSWWVYCWVQGYIWVSDHVRLKGWQLRMGILLGTGVHLCVRPCQSEGVTAQCGSISG